MRLLYMLAFIAISSLGQAQVSLKFCVEVKQGGNCQSSSTEFDITTEGGTITFLLLATDSLNTTNVYYKLYSILPDGTEVYLKDIQQPVDKGWTYAWQDVVFYDPGLYKVRAYDADHDNNFLCSGLVRLYTRP
ncbi:MAG: hypothetical protein U0T75_16145 [Chitinophagales bacterium]